MNTQQRIGRLEALLERVRQRARGARSIELTRTPSEDAILLKRETSVAMIEVVDSAPLEALDEEDVLDLSSDVLESVPPPAAVTSVTSLRPEAPSSAPWQSEPEDLGPEDLPEDMGALEEFLRAGENEQPEEHEQAPASSKRHRIAIEEDITGTLSADAVREHLLVNDEEEHEVPLKTPPPESGPQEAPPLSVSNSSSLPADLLTSLPSRAPEVDFELQSEDALESAPPVAESEPASELVAQPATLVQVATRSAAPSDVSPIAYTGSAARPEAPKSFAELLDASLRLGS